MTAIPTEILVGTSFGLTVGLIVGLIVGLLTILHRAVRGVPIPIVGVVGLSIVGGVTITYFSGLITQLSIADPVSAVRLFVIVTVVSLLGVYASSQGERIAQNVTRPTRLPVSRGHSLSAEAFDSIDAIGQVKIRLSGTVEAVDGYPSISPSIQRTLETSSWRFPADLSLEAFENRLETQLRTLFGLRHVSVSVDSRGLASVSAAPPSETVSADLPPGYRALSMRTLLPTGVAPGDVVEIVGAGKSVSGQILSIREDRNVSVHRSLDSDVSVSSHEPRIASTESVTPSERTETSITNGNSGTSGEPQSDFEDLHGVDADNRGHNNGSSDWVDTDVGRSKTISTVHSHSRRSGRTDRKTVGGSGQVSLAIPTSDSGAVLPKKMGQVVVPSIDATPAFDAISLLERAGMTVRKFPRERIPSSWLHCGELDANCREHDEDCEMPAANGSNDVSGSDPNSFHVLAANRPSRDVIDESWIFEPSRAAIDRASMRELGLENLVDELLQGYRNGIPTGNLRLKAMRQLTQ